ncbi:MAG: DUF2993 domain-containing protein [Candidatus Nanopelagicales bacterium]
MTRTVRRWLIAVGVLLVLLVVADRVAAQVVEGYAERELQAALGTPTAPSVELRGFPALTQLLRQQADRVDIIATDVPADRIVVDRLDAELRDVSIDRDAGSATAGSVTGTALLGWDDIATASGLGLVLSPLPDGQVQVERTAELLGVEVRVRGSVQVSVEPSPDGAGDVVRLQATSAEVVEPVGFAAPGRLVGLLSTTVPVTGLPSGLRLNSVTATGDGALAEVSGEDVTFS